MREVILQSLGTQTSQLPIVLTPMKSFAKLENLHLYMEKKKKIKAANYQCLTAKTVCQRRKQPTPMML